MYLTDKLCKIGSDKYVHLIVSLLITFFIGRGVSLVCVLSLPVCALIGAGVGFIIGVAKEALDDKFDKGDLLADLIGCLLGFMVTAM